MDNYTSAIEALVKHYGEYLELGQTTIFAWRDERAAQQWQLAEAGDEVVAPNIYRQPSSADAGICSCGHDYQACALIVVAVDEQPTQFRVLGHRACVILAHDV